MPDNRIPTNQSQIDIKDSIDLLTANINRTADNIAYDSNLTIKGKIQAIDLTSGGTIKGDLYIDDESGTTATEGTTYLSAGNDKATGTDKNSTGILRLYGDSGKCAFLYPQSQMSANRWIALPDKAGTIALTSDLQGEAVTITPAQNATVTLNNVKKLGKLIAGTCGINYSFTANSWIVIATTTEKPPSNVFYSALNPATGGTIGMVQITTTGNIQAYLTTSASGILFSPIYWVN